VPPVCIEMIDQPSGTWPVVVTAVVPPFVSGNSAVMPSVYPDERRPPPGLPNLTRRRRRRQEQACSVIGATGFEPATARPPAECATRLRHAPKRATGIEPALEAWKIPSHALGRSHSFPSEAF
jgi:hypothetical protein